MQPIKRIVCLIDEEEIYFDQVFMGFFKKTKKE